MTRNHSNGKDLPPLLFTPLPEPTVIHRDDETAAHSEFSALSGGKTGWPAGLLQDDSREVSRWLASKPDARYLVRIQSAVRELDDFPATVPGEMT